MTLTEPVIMWIPGRKTYRFHPKFNPHFRLTFSHYISFLKSNNQHFLWKKNTHTHTQTHTPYDGFFFRINNMSPNKFSKPPRQKSVAITDHLETSSSWLRSFFSKSWLFTCILRFWNTGFFGQRLKKRLVWLVGRPLGVFFKQKICVFFSNCQVVQAVTFWSPWRSLKKGHLWSPSQKGARSLNCQLVD